jgi:hypothetical protein
MVDGQLVDGYGQTEYTTIGTYYTLVHKLTPIFPGDYCDTVVMSRCWSTQSASPSSTSSWTHVIHSHSIQNQVPGTRHPGRSTWKIPFLRQVPALSPGRQTWVASGCQKISPVNDPGDNPLGEPAGTLECWTKDAQSDKKGRVVWIIRRGRTGKETRSRRGALTWPSVIKLAK